MIAITASFKSFFPTIILEKKLFLKFWLINANFFVKNWWLEKSLKANSYAFNDITNENY